MIEGEIAITPRMQLDDVGADGCRCLDGLEVGLDEQRDANTGALQFCDERLQRFDAAPDIEPAFRRALLAPLRHKATGVRHMAQRDLQHLIRCRHFEIERPRQLVLEPGDVRIRDVTAVFAQMRGDAVGTALDCEMGCPQRIGMHAAAGIPQRRDVIDVDAEAQRARRSGHGYGLNGLT